MLPYCNCPPFLTLSPHYSSPLQKSAPPITSLTFPHYNYSPHKCHYFLPICIGATIALYTLPPFPQREQVQNCFTPCTLHMHTHVSAIPHRQHLVLRIVLKLSYTLSYTWWVCVTLLHCCTKLACTKCECIPHRGHIVLHLVSYKTPPPWIQPCPCPAMGEIELCWQEQSQTCDCATSTVPMRVHMFVQLYRIACVFLRKACSYILSVIGTHDCMLVVKERMQSCADAKNSCNCKTT